MAAMNGAAGANLRLANKDDAAAIAEIYNEAIATTTATFDVEPRSAEDRAAWLETHDERHPVFVAEVDGGILSQVLVLLADLFALGIVDEPVVLGVGEVALVELHRGAHVEQGDVLNDEATEIFYLRQFF
jgi:hypothetical protein